LPTYRRSRETRALSVLCALLFAALEIAHLGTGGLPFSGGGLFLIFLAAVGVGGGLLNLGDRYRIDEEGIEYSNPLLARIGIRLGRRVAWHEVTSMRIHRSIRHGARNDKPDALFLQVRSGRRLVLDSLERFDEVVGRVRGHLASRLPIDLPRGAESADRLSSAP
jgi:hypothetical protein